MSEISQANVENNVRCEQILVDQALQLIGKIPVEQTLDLENRETLYVQSRTIEEGDDTIVVRHRRTNLEQNREDQYFVLRPNQQPPTLDCFVDDLNGENQLVEDGEFELIPSMRNFVMDLAVTSKSPADSHDGDELNRLLRQVTGR